MQLYTKLNTQTIRRMLDKPLDDISEPEKPTTNYKKWSFRLLIYTLVSNFALAYVVSSFHLNSPEAFGFNVLVLSILSSIFFLSGIALTILSHINREERNYQYQISVWGFLIFILLTITTAFA